MEKKERVEFILEQMRLCLAEIQVGFLGWEDPLEEELATHSSILA